MQCIRILSKYLMKRVLTSSYESSCWGHERPDSTDETLEMKSDTYQTCLICTQTK